MKIYFDESGNTGCVLSVDDLLTFRTQPIFAIGAVIVKDDSDEKKLLEKYRRFKSKFNIYGEIKGNEITTRKRNGELKYLLQYIFDSKHFSVNLYDKRFYISTLLILALMGREFQANNLVLFYQLASSLSFQDDDFFIQYCNYIKDPTPESFHNYLIYLKDYPYLYLENEYNGIKVVAEYILNNNQEKVVYDDFMTFGWYSDSKITNLINLNALSESIYFIKSNCDYGNEEITYIHDKIYDYESIIKEELLDLGIAIDFPHENEPELLQLADNISSLMCHFCVKAKSHITKKAQWSDESEWDMKILSRLVSKIGSNNIKFTLPIPDWAMVLSVRDMFIPSFPRKQRNNFVFNAHYASYETEIWKNLNQQQREVFNVLDVLKR